MTPEHWQRIKPLLESALERDAGERAAFLNQACAGDELLRKELDSFIVSHDRAESFIEEPAFKMMAESIANTEADSMVGHSFGHYEIIEQLGAGGMGEVYLAQDARLGRKVALKMLPAYFTAHDERVRRFRQEARTASALNHPNILTIFEVGQVDSRHFIATELIEGETLRRRMTEGEIEVGQALDFAIQVASALSAAHQAGIVHRDIKPENIMLRRDGIIKVLDFGLAKLTEHETGDFERTTLVDTKQGVVMGTARYMSPEQARGLKIDGRSDVWSLAVVLYEMIFGRPPFEGKTASDVIVSILEKEPAPLTSHLAAAPKELHEILTKALRKDVEQRYQTSSAILADLKGLKDGLEFEAKLKRSLTPNSNEGAIVVPARGNKQVETPAIRTAKIDTAGATTSREYVINVTRLQKTSVAVVAAIALLVVAWVIYSSFTGGTRKIHSLAVLPFKSVDGQGRDEPLELGMADALIARLSGLKQIDVRSSGAVFRYAGQNTDRTQAGRELKVDAVLEGNIQRQGNQVRVSVQLVNVADGKTLWADTFDAKATDFFATQDALAEQIIRPLTFTLTGAEQNTEAKRNTSNPEAYQLFLKGRYWFGKNTPEGFHKACDYFNQSIALDKNYAVAYSGLADCHSLLASTRPPAEDLLAAKAAAEKAVQLDDKSAAGHISLGHLRWLTWDWEGAEKEFKRGVEIDPPWPAAHLWYAWYFSSLGRHQEAAAIIRKAQEKTPISIIINECAEAVHYFARQYDEAIAMGLKTLELEPNRIESIQWLALAYEQKHMYDEAVAADLKARSLRGVKPEALDELRGAYGAAGWRGYWLKQIERTRAAAKERYVAPYRFAEMYARVGDKERAFEFLEKAYVEHSGELNLLKVTPVFDSLRSDSRYAHLMRRVGLPE